MRQVPLFHWCLMVKKIRDMFWLEVLHFIYNSDWRWRPAVSIRASIQCCARAKATLRFVRSHGAAARRPAGWWLGRVGVGELDRYDCYSGVSRLFGAANYVKLRTRSGCWRKISRWRILSLSNDRLNFVVRQSNDRYVMGVDGSFVAINPIWFSTLHNSQYQEVGKHLSSSHNDQVITHWDPHIVGSQPPAGRLPRRHVIARSVRSLSPADATLNTRPN